MHEQTYMRLGDKVKRPVFNPDKIDRNNPSFKRLVDAYVRWQNDDSVDRSEFENDIIGCLKEFSQDGYALARHLENTIGLEPDTHLVEILDRVHSLKYAMLENLERQWVKENFLEISDDVIGKKVTYKQNWSEGSGFITTINKESYKVTVDTNPDKKGGYVINYENINFEGH